MKKYLVIGNPVEHSLSPELHNFWFKENNIDAIYEKKQLSENNIKKMISEIKNEKIDGVNVTIPFKKSIIPFLDQLTPKAILTQSVNTIFKEGDVVIGDNTDIGGFELSLKEINYNPKNKKVLILGAGGVCSSIILALKGFGASRISLMNRTKSKAEVLKKMHSDLLVLDWGQINDFDMIINTTSVGLKNEDKIKLDFSKIGSGKLFYDVIYNPSKTDFLLRGEKLGNKIKNGKMMFIYQAQLAFKVWHNVLPRVHDKLLEK